MSLISLFSALALTYESGQQGGAVGLCLSLVFGLAAGVGVFLGFRRAGERLLKVLPDVKERRPTFRDELPFLALFIATWIGIAVATVLVGRLVRAAIP